MRQVLGPGALGRPRGIGCRGRWEGGLGWGIYVNPWLIHVNVWQKPLPYCKVISLQLIKINGKKKKNKQTKKNRKKNNPAKNEDHGIQSHHFMANIWETMETVRGFILGGPKSLQMMTAAMKLREACSLEEKL